MARPRKKIDYELVKKLSVIHCTQEEIAAVLELSVDTLQRDAKFNELYNQERQRGRASLRRLQWKAAEIADAIMHFLKPKGAIVLLKAQHMCMLSRGIQKQNSVMVTSAIRGNLEQSTSRSEFFSAINI